MRSPTTWLLALGASLLLAPAAHADTILASAPGAENLGAAGGYAAWAAPAAQGRWKLVVRAPDGSVADAPVPTFGSAPDISVGSDAFVQQQIAIVYSRCAGSSATKACDVYSYNTNSKTERKVSGASSAGYSETSPSISSGRIAFVRRGGARPGTYVAIPRFETKSMHVNRVDSHVAREVAVSQSRVVFLYRNANGQDDLTLAQLDGTRKRLIVRAKAGTIFSPVITRYKVGWLQRSGSDVLAKLTARINPSTTKPDVRTGTRPLPASTDSATADSSIITTYLDAEGVKRISPAILHA